MIPFQKIIAWFLIGLLFFEATFRVPFLLPDASALESANHEDVVSLIVEEELFRKMSSDIDAYARRIQSRLSHTRTVILTYARDAHPYLIASSNERLYFSGIPNHGNKTQKLVGTILIGHVPLPVVHKDNKDFLSLYPYTDFDEPHFFWNWETSRYEYLNQKRNDIGPDIWHSVIDPNTGNLDTDVQKIRDFFARVYEFDAKKGRYENVGTNPQVLYMDSVNESRAASKGLLAVYEQIFVPQQEHLLYHRFTREFAQYLYASFLSLMKSEGSTKISSYREWTPDANSTSSFLSKASDISTKVFSDELITPFLKVINEKYLGDLNRWVHNTGRYYNGYSDVRVDTIPELITTKDALVGQVIKESNDALEKMIDVYIDSNLALDIPILVSRPGQKTISEKSGERFVSRTYNFVYDNYFYGTKASEIINASQCSLIRGTSFGGENTTVETNHGFDIVGAKDDSKRITADVNAGIKCTSPTQSYWGGNSPINATYKDGEMLLNTHRYDDFSLPVLDLGAGKKTTGVNSPLDCLRNDLILRPYQHNGLENRKYLWPTETGGTRYSCATPLQSPTPNPFFLDPTPETSENILSSLVACGTNNGNITLLNRNGASLGTCQATGLSGTYKRISSLVKHSDPTTNVYGQQLKGNATPNLPIDEERYLLYIDRTGGQARIDYPNLFDIIVDPDDTDDDIINKIRSTLNAAQNRLTPTVTLPANHRWHRLIQSPTPAVNLADVLLSNSDIKTGLVDALRWKNLDVEMKYSDILKTALKPTATSSKLLLPDKKDLYEITYLGGQGDARNFVFGFNPEAKTELPEWFTDIQESHGDVVTTLGTFSSDSNPEYSLSSSEIAELLGEGTSGTDGGDTSSDGSSDAASDSSDSECGDPTGVVIWEWLSAIQCWLSNLMKTDWFTPDIDDIGFPELPSLTVSFGGDIVWSTKELQNIGQTDANNNSVNDYVEKNTSSLTLTNTLSSTTIEPTQSLRIDTALENSTSLINDDTTRIVLEVTRIDDLDEGKSYSAKDTGWSEIQNRYFSVSGGNTLKDGHAVWIFTSKNNHRTRIAFESRIYSGSNILLRSERSSVLIGPINLGMTVLSTSGSTTSETITAGDSNGINILLSGLDIYPSTADITLYDYVTGEQKLLYKSVPITNGRIRLGSPSIDPVLYRAGRYTLIAVVGDYSGKTNFTIATGKPHHIDATLDALLIKDTPTQLTLSLRDEWNNVINAQGWNLQVQSSQNMIVAPIGSKAGKTVSGKMTSPLTLTPIEAGNITLDIIVSRDAEKINLSLSRPVLSDAYIVVDIPNRAGLEVGQEVPVNFSIQRQDGTLIEDWNMSVKIGVRGGNAKLSSQTLTFVKGRAATTLQTGTKTGTAVIYLQDTGLGKIIGDSFAIAPGIPTSIALSAPETIHAKIGARDTLNAYLYDAYGNLTTLHGYTWKITTDKPSLLSNTLTFGEIGTGVYQADIISSGTPGRLLFRAWLEKDDTKSNIKTLENVALTNALPVITSDEASQNSWQTLTQVLLGAAFGQSPIQGYFAGASLFASTTKTLALSTLVDTPQNPIFTVSPSGNIITGSLKYGTGVEAQIESYQNNTLTVIVYDTRLGGIARVRYPAFSSDVLLTSCTTSCDRDILYFVPNNSDITYKDGRVYNGTQSLFSLKDIFSFPNLSFAFVHQNTEYLQFLVTYNGVSLGTVYLRWKSRVPAEQGSENTSNTYTLESLRSTLSTKLAWSNKSSYETPSLVLYTTGEETTYVGGAHDRGWSAYPQEYGLGWTHDNTSLLQFAATEEWSSSVRDNADYVTINLGDPIVKLPNYQVNPVTGLDQTLGKPVYMGTSDIDDFTFRDTNSDGKKDLIVYHPDGTIGMGLSRGDGSMIDVGDLLSVKDAQEGMVRAGDFIGDGYSDIVYIDAEGVIHQVVHSEEGPTEKPMKYDKTPLLGQIEQLEVFDMDHDAIDDIIVMDNLGSLYIFYGQKTGIFTVQLIENVYDFVLSDEAKSSYFTGAVSYNGLGFVDPDNLPKASSFELQSKQDQVNQLLFTQIRLAKTGTANATPTVSSAVVNTLDVDPNGLLRMYDGNATTLTSSLQFGYGAVSDSAGSAATVSGGTESYDTFDLLRAPFIIPGYLSITKQYTSLEQSGQILAGSPIQVTITLKNVSKQNMSNILLLEKFADYLSVSDMSYSLVAGSKKETRNFLADSTQSNAGIADLRDVTLAPGSSLTVTYKGTLRSFSFGRFDVGYLEDKDDPTSTSVITKENIRTINSSALALSSIPEKDFYNHDVYGDIRFNPNETCGGPVLLWRSHNEYDRTYHKAILVREVTNPDDSASKLSQDPTSAFESTPSSGSKNSTTSSTQGVDIDAVMAESESTLETWQSDSDADSIPDKDDDDHGDVFEVSTSGNTTKISVGLGKIDSTIDDITKGVKDIISGLSCGFGDPGCISMPINWAANIPGNTVTALGYAIPGANQPPIACHKDVRCGYPVFAYPTICSTTGYPTCTWPSDSEGAGGAFDYYGGSAATGGNGLNDAPNAGGSVSAVSAGSYMPGEGISEFRLFIGATLTGAIAEVFCFGPNNAISNVPGLFPLRFDGNCIFATQPLFQCSDDGSDDEPLVMELDISDELSDDMDDGSDDGVSGNGNSFTNADECNFFESVDSYPTDLSALTDAYFKQTNDTTVSALQASISENASVVNESQSTDTALEFSTTSTSSAYERLNGQNGLEYTMSNGTGMIQIALDPSAMKFKDFGKVIDINLKSIKGFPNFIMDWYQRQMDEIMSSLTHLPDIKIFLPDLSALADSGWMSSFGSGLKDKLGNIVNSNSPSSELSTTGQKVGQLADVRQGFANELNNPAVREAFLQRVQAEVGSQGVQAQQAFMESVMNRAAARGTTLAAQVSQASGYYPESSRLGSVSSSLRTNSDTMIKNVLSGSNVSNFATGNASESVGFGWGSTHGGETSSFGGERFGVEKVDSGWVKNMQNYSNNSSGSISSSSGSATGNSTGNNASGSGVGNFVGNVTNTVKSGWNGAFGGVNSGLDKLSSGVGTVLGGAENAANSVASAVQQKTAGIQNAFEYLGTLPIIDVHPETISFDIPWVGKQEAQAWIARNQAILDAWKKLPVDAANSVYIGPLIASIESNIETVRSYFELPERLQTLFYLKEKLLYGILQNVKAVQDLMGGWLYQNGQRFKGWVEAFILITKLFDLWQVLLDVFNDYEVECGECRNERWNLQHWLWIVISAIIPPIPIIEMPRWPDIELDFSDIDLSLDIAYPVFDLNFYPISLPDAPAPTLSGFPLNAMPQLPQIPDLNIDFEIPVIKLPKLPDLPPPPKIPELSQAIEVVLKIFKILVLIQCLYRKIPLSPEWVVGTKVAHKTERQGYLPFDFLDSRLPTVSMEWLEAIRVSTHVKLDYDVDFVIDVLREALEPFTNFPKNIGQISGSSGSNNVNFNINPESGVEVKTSSIISEQSLAQVPDLIRQLFAAISDTAYVDPQNALRSLSSVTQNLDISPERKKQIAALLEPSSHVPDFSHIQKNLDNRFDQIAQAVQMDVAENRKNIDDLVAWKGDQKSPENIPLIAQNIVGSVHFAQNNESMSHILALTPDITRPIMTGVHKLQNSVSPIVAPLVVSPTPEPVAAPDMGNIYENMVESEKLTKTQGLYVTNGTTTHRLIDYTENLDGNTKIHTVDDDGDGDLDVYYSLGNTVYRKENYAATPTKYLIKDAPQVYTTADIYTDFFDVSEGDVANIISDGQINILQNHAPGKIRYQMLMKKKEGHTRLRLFRSLFKNDSKDARYQVDIVPKNSTSSGLTIQNVPRILDIDGLVFIEHKKIYRTLLTNKKFINENGKEENLSDDFVIRSGQSGYVSESTTLDITSGGKTTQQKMTVGQRIIFAGDSRVVVRKGSFILFGNTAEKRPLSIRDTHMPLLPGDLLITDKNGGITVKFPDGTETDIAASQYWTLTEYEPGIGIKKLTLPAEAEWYYGTIMDAKSPLENKIPHGTVFDAHTDFSESDVISQIPRQITLSVPGPTEIDFQTYFPADTLTNVEIFRLPSSEWRRVSTAKIAFEAQKEKTEILVRVTTTSGRVRDYATQIVTLPPKLYIDSVDPSGILTGKITNSSGNVTLGVQSYIDGQSWTLVNNFQNSGDDFSTTIARSATKMSVQQGSSSLVTFDRNTATPVLASNITMTPSISLGKTLGYSLYDGKNERVSVAYQGQNITYKQIANLAEVNTSGIFVLGSGLRLEPATTNDANLKGGVYITDSTYRPIVTLDNTGVIRTLDTNISWSVKLDNNRVTFTLTRDRQELGKIILAGDMITYWAQ